MSGSESLQPASTTRTALLLVDIQSGLNTSTGFFGTERSTPRLESNLTTLLARVRAYNTEHAGQGSKQVLIIHINHNSTNPKSPLYPGKSTNSPMPCAAPLGDEPLLYKSIHSAFGNKALEPMLREHGVRQLLVCGITTAHCVSTTVRVASDLNIVGEGGVLALIEDCSAAFSTEKFDAETVHAVNVASLEDEFAKIGRVGDVVDRILM
jgi:nicotinamidase-related amidase